VVTPVIDFLLNNKEEFCVDTQRIALMGISMGGLRKKIDYHL